MLEPRFSETRSLLHQYDFQPLPHDATDREKLSASHKRAKAIGLAYGLTYNDILNLTPRFWDFWADPIMTVDGAAATILLIQLNLAAGTVASYIQEGREDLQSLFDDIMAFRVSCQYLMTELGHGLDAINIETTATLRKNGTFDLHTPCDRAAKFMPPTLPLSGLPCVGIVMARLVVDDGDRGLRPFVVPLNDGAAMCAGVVARELPTRSGAGPVGHAITRFEHVSLPSSALLGNLQAGTSAKRHFQRCARRIGVGSITITAFVIPGLRIAAYIASRYSLRRTVRFSQDRPVPIINFRTQHAPIARAVAYAAVLEAFYHSMSRSYTSDAHDQLPALMKAVASKHWSAVIPEITSRLGAQGLFDFNQIIRMDLEWRGGLIAEGDVLVLSIRCAFEMLTGKWDPPPPMFPDSPLSRHEDGLLTEFRTILFDTDGDHRSEGINQKLMPRCLDLVRAVGERMAFEAAIVMRVPKPLIDLYEAASIISNSAWYVEHMKLGRVEQMEKERVAITDVALHLEQYLEACKVSEYCSAAILSEESWTRFLNSLQVFGGKDTDLPLCRL